MGFPAKWIKWIKVCIESPTVSVLVNGSPTDEFKMGRGLRQGDPLAPFLFLVVAEGLAALMRRAVERNYFKGIKVGAGGLSVSMLQFADDTVFFGEPSLQNIITLKSILRCFEIASGLRVNFFKSSLTGISVSGRSLNTFADTLNCRMMSIPFIYLGLPVGANPRSLATWRPVIEKVKKRLSSWSQQMLSFGGRVCLIKSVLTAIPLYFLSLFRAPQEIIKKINSLQRKFLWGSKGVEKKVAWVKWEACCKERVKGGLGIKNIEKFNKALVGKWLWRVLSEKDKLWVRVLEAKYGRGEQWFQREGRIRGSVWWCDLRKICQLDVNSGWMENKLCRKVGNGENIKFWEECWIGQESLKIKFNRIFLVSDQQECYIYEMGEWVGEEWRWKLEWRREWFEWEKVLLTSFMQVLLSVSLRRDRKDGWTWNNNPTVPYSVKEAYGCLLLGQDPPEADVFNFLWSKWIPSKVNAFGWRLLLNRIQIKDNLLNRGSTFQGGNVNCEFCEGTLETASHCFLSCRIIYKIWGGCYNWLGVNCVLPHNAFDHLRQHVGLGYSKKRSMVWQVIWFAVVWIIWKSRNKKIFEGVQINLEKIHEDIIFTSWKWLRGRHKGFTHTLYDWSQQPMFCINS